MKKFGFTLSETLIALAVIGVVAAITLPNVMSNHQKRILTTQLHKVYNDLGAAAKQYMTDERVDSFYETNFSNDIGSFVTEYFDVATDCQDTACFDNDYTDLSLNDIDAIECNYKFRGRDNIAYCFSGYNVTVDVNGPQGPNILGRDLFQDITINEQGDLVSSDGTHNYFNKIIKNNWKMDY